MKSISIKQPFANLIKVGYKTIEVRSWKTDFRGDILICSSKQPFILFAKSGKSEAGEYTIYEKEDPENTYSVYLGAAICVAELFNITPFEKQHEEEANISHMPNNFAWHLRNIRLIKPFELTGKLRFFETNDNKIIYL